MERSKRLSFTWMRQNQFIFMFFDSCVAVKAILQGILETKNFKGEALVVYHTSKYTGTHDTGVLASEKVGFAIYVTHIYIYIHNMQTLSQIQILDENEKTCQECQSEISLPSLACFLYQSLSVFILLYPSLSLFRPFCPCFYPPFRYSSIVGAFVRSPLQGSCIRGQQRTNLCKPVT